MSASYLTLPKRREQAPGDLGGLYAVLSELVGEPFRFMRVSYGDELTIHFGDLRAAKSPKLNKQPYGAFILGTRGSPWLLKSESLVVSAGVPVDLAPSQFAEPISKDDLERRAFIEPESRVLAAIPFIVRPWNGYALQMTLSDGTKFLILPSLPQPDEEEIESLPELADWELISPRGQLSVGPELKWSFIPRG